MLFRKSLTTITATVVAATTVASPAFARVSSDVLDYYSANDIMYYDPSASSAGDICTSVSASNMSPSEIKEYVWSFLTTTGGLSEVAAAGIMGNIQQESGFRPEAVEVTTRADKGFGLVQWTFGRRDAIEAAAAAEGRSATDLKFQLEYLMRESSGRSGAPANVNPSTGAISTNPGAAPRYEYDGTDAMKEWERQAAQTTIEKSTAYWHDAFERSGGDTAKINERIAHAISYYNMYSSGETLSMSCGSGFTREQADTHIAIYRNLDNGTASSYGLAVGCHDRLVENCVSYSLYFINKFRKDDEPLITRTGNGGQVASNLINNFGFVDGGHTPKPFAVFSTSSGTTMCGATKCGHTGVVLAVDRERGTVLIGEAGYCSSIGSVSERSLADFETERYTYAYTDNRIDPGKLFEEF